MSLGETSAAQRVMALVFWSQFLTGGARRSAIVAALASGPAGPRSCGGGFGCRSVSGGAARAVLYCQPPLKINARVQYARPGSNCGRANATTPPALKRSHRKPRSPRYFALAAEIGRRLGGPGFAPQAVQPARHALRNELGEFLEHVVQRIIRVGGWAPRPVGSRSAHAAGVCREGGSARDARWINVLISSQSKNSAPSGIT